MQVQCLLAMDDIEMDEDVLGAADGATATDRRAEEAAMSPDSNGGKGQMLGGDDDEQQLSPDKAAVGLSGSSSTRLADLMLAINGKKKCGDEALSQKSHVSIVGNATFGVADGLEDEKMEVRPSAGGQHPCFVCGKFYPVMPRNSFYCFLHKRAVDTLVGKWRIRVKPGQTKDQAAATDPFKEEKACYKRLVSEKTLPPSKFSMMVLQYMEDFSSEAKGSRHGFSCVQWVESEVRKTTMTRGFKEEYMHKTEYVEWVCKKQQISQEDAFERWNRRKDTLPTSLHLENGPADEPLRLPFVTSDYITGETSIEHERRMVLTSKAKKICNENDVAEARDQLTRGNIDFGSEAFGNMGTAVVSEITPGQKRGFNEDNGCKALSLPGADVAPEKPAQKKQRAFVQDTATVHLRNYIQNTIKKVQTNVSKVHDVIQNASDLAQVAVDIPNLTDYVAIMNRRNIFFDVICISNSHADGDGGLQSMGLTFLNDKDDQEFNCVKKWHDIVVSYHDNTEGSSDLLTAVSTTALNNELGAIADERIHRITLLLRRWNWDAEAKQFSLPVDIKVSFILSIAMAHGPSHDFITVVVC